MNTHYRNAAFAIAGSLLLMISAAAHDRRHSHGMSMNVPDEVRSCSDIEIDFDGKRPARAEESLTAAAGTLNISPPQNGHVHVVGSDAGQYSISVCKAARAESLLGRVKAAISGSELTISGPADGDDWVAFVLVQAPRGSTMNLSTHNGGISLDTVEGTFTARALNGPVSVKNSKGKIDVQTQNGPISFEGSGGDLRLVTQNGPIDIDLNGSAWEGRGLDAKAQNGPLAVSVPSSYQSGVEVSASGHSPFSCSSDVCGKGERTWDDEGRRVQLGTGAPVVKASTVNGPVAVSARKSSL
jgi:DUF4097 and DUF4098 domain-containing protein YvlB